MDETYYDDAPEVVEEITQIALEHRLMSQFTSFVAVDETDVKSEETVKPPRRISVPVPLPLGVDYHGIFGPDQEGVECDAALDIKAMSSLGYLSGRRASASSMELSLDDFVLHSTSRGVSLGDIVRTHASMSSPSPAYGRYTQTKVPSSAPAGMGYGMGGVAFVPQKGVARRAGNFNLYAEESALYWHDLVPPELPVDADLKKDIQEAGSLFEKAQKLESEGNLREAWSRYQMAYLLDRASGSQAGVSEKALDALEKLQVTYTEKQIQKLSALDKKLNLVIRNQSLQDALEKIGKSIGVSIRLHPGAEKDALQLSNQSDLHIIYRDLRNMKAADALDLLLDPYNLTWQGNGKSRVVDVDSTRQLPGQWPWVYDVSLLSTPSQEELGQDYKEAQMKSRELAQEFLETIQTALNGSKDNKVCWLTSGQILVDGDQGFHGRMKVLLDYLKDENAGVSLKISEEALKELNKLRQQTSKRYADRKARLEKHLDMKEQAKVLSLQGQASWQLLSDAVKSRFNLESMTELQYAFSHSSLKNQNNETYRALWVLSESSLALPDQKELKNFSKQTLIAQSPLFQESLTRLGSNPNDVP